MLKQTFDCLGTPFLASTVEWSATFAIFDIGSYILFRQQQFENMIVAGECSEVNRCDTILVSTG